MVSQPRAGIHDNQFPKNNYDVFSDNSYGAVVLSAFSLQKGEIMERETLRGKFVPITESILLIVEIKSKN